MISLSKRLQAVADMVECGGVAADIGCDHGFTSIYLAESGRAAAVIAMDIAEGPLERAREHILQYGMQDRITLRRSDGAQMLAPGEADCLLISGMGGALICRILRESAEVVAAVRELVLSPQSEIGMVRHFLHEMGFRIDREEMLIENGKYYTVMRAVPGQEQYLSEEEYIYGGYLMRTSNPVLCSFLMQEEKRIEGILQKMKGETLSAGAAEQRDEWREKLAILRRTRDVCKAKRII